MLCYGADSHIRLLDQGPASGEEQFPVYKVAASDRQRRFIVDEFEILRGLGPNAAPAVRVHSEPLVDGKGIFGFRMEKLEDLPQVPNLEIASKTFFKESLEGSDPLFDNGWRGWPEGAKQVDVLSWFADFTEKLAAFAESYNSAPAQKRRPLAKPDESIAGSVAERKIHVGSGATTAPSKQPCNG